MTDRPAAPRLRAATYNIHSCVGRDGRYHPGRIADVLAEIGADVLGLQEVDSRPHRTETIDQFLFLAQETGLHAVAGPNIRNESGQYGNVLLSTHPILGHRLIDLSEPGREARGAIAADLKVAGAALRVVTTHLGVRLGERRRQVAKLAANLTDDGTPTLFLGDFNIWGPERIVLRRLGASAGRGSPRTYPSGWPLFALDRMWCLGAARAGALRTHRSALARRASDHLPLVGDIEIGTK